MRPRRPLPDLGLPDLLDDQRLFETQRLPRQAASRPKSRMPSRSRLIAPTSGPPEQVLHEVGRPEVGLVAGRDDVAIGQAAILRDGQQRPVGCGAALRDQRRPGPSGVALGTTRDDAVAQTLAPMLLAPRQFGPTTRRPVSATKLLEVGLPLAALGGVQLGEARRDDDGRADADLGALPQRLQHPLGRHDDAARSGRLGRSRGDG